MKLASMLLQADAPGHPTEVIDRGRRLSRDEVRRETAQYVEYLRRHGVSSRDRILAIGTHDVRGLELLSALSVLGVLVMMPYNLSQAAAAEWVDIAGRARPDHIVLAEAEPTVLRALRQTGIHTIDLSSAPAEVPSPPPLDQLELADSVEDFLVLFTSGTTGTPKGICVSEALMCRRIQSVTGRLGFHAEARVFMSGLINNTTGVILSFGALLHSARLIYPDGRNVAGWPQQVAGHRASHIMLRPVAMAEFVDAAEAGGVDLSSLQCVAYGAAAMPRDLLERARQLIPCDFVQGYGLSETYGPFCWLDEQAHAERRQDRGSYCVGRPDETVQLRLQPLAGHEAPSGELQIRSDAIMRGYFDPVSGRIDPPPPWFPTGDIARWNPDGDLLLKGRIHASILSRNGHRIYPEEVEAVLARIPQVREVVVVGLQHDPQDAERPVACLAGPIASYDTDTARAVLLDALRAELSPEKWPEAFLLSSTPLPKSVNDKIRRNAVKTGLDLGGLVPIDPHSRRPTTEPAA